MNRPDTLRTPRLTLRAYAEHDRDALIALLRHPLVSETFLVPDLTDEATADKLFSRMRALSQDSAHCEYGVFIGNTLIGLVRDVDAEDNEVELGYAFHPDYHGKGYATEAVRAVMDMLKQQGVACVRAECFEENNASLRVMEKCGMTRTDNTNTIEYRGRMRQCICCEKRL